MADENSWLADMSQDVPDEDKLRIALRQQRIAQSMQTVPQPDREWGRYDRLRFDTARAGAAFGNALSEKISGEPPIPEDMQNKINAIKETKDNFEKWTADPTNKDADSNARAEQWQKYAVESAFKNNLPDIGIKALRDLQDRKAVRARQDAELESLGYQNEVDKATVQAKIGKALYDAHKAGMVQVYPIGSNNPNAGQVGHLDTDGSVTLANGQKLPPYAYSFERPDWLPRVSGGSGEGDMTAAIGKTEAGKVRDLYANTAGQLQSFIEVDDLLNEAFQKGGPGQSIMGDYGKGLSFTNRLVDSVDSLARDLAPDGKAGKLTMIGKDGYGRTQTTDLSDPNARAEWARQNSGSLRQYLPPKLRQNAQMADRYIALMTELAYAKARASEGGSTRSLSDLDFRNNMDIIGARLSDPVALKKVLFADAIRSHKILNQRLSMYAPKDRSNLIYKDAADQYDSLWGEMNRRFGPNSNTGEAPAGGAAPAAAAPTLSKEDQAAGWTIVNGMKVREVKAK